VAATRPRKGHDWSALSPIGNKSGTVRITDSSNSPASKTIAAALVEIEPAGLRELR
jgi:oxalate decarboxylase